MALVWFRKAVGPWQEISIGLLVLDKVPLPRVGFVVCCCDYP